jgi:hypothetical protein
MLLKSLAALGFAQVLPGLFLAKLLGLGRSLEERLLIGIVLGGPLAALLYLAVLLSGVDSAFWIPAALLGLGGALYRPKPRLALAWPRGSRFALGAVLAAVLVPYLATTGSRYRVDERGELVLDRALQRDALFHLGIIRSLETSYPPRLLSVSGEPIGYHPGYHLELALWSRFFGISPEDGLVRLGPLLHITLYVLLAYVLAVRLLATESARILCSVLVLGSGLGFLFFSRASVDWWSLAFMDWALVSIFLPNPLLAALPLLFVGLALLHDYQETGARGSLAGGAFALSFLFWVKMFLGAQALAALAFSALWTRERRALRTFASVALASLPLLVQTLFAAAGSNTAVGVRPLEIVRYSMEKLSLSLAVNSLADVGNLATPRDGWLLVLGATFLWAVGFLGLRVLGLRAALRDLSSRSYLPIVLAWFAVISIPLSLLLRIAPEEARGLSRLEALNDAPWFLAAGGIALWFPTARALSALRPETAWLAVAFLALPATVQHFFHAADAGVDRVSRTRVEAASVAERLSAPESVWVEPPDRSRPSVLAYFAGRPVVYDPYVGYDYMFVGREEIEYRRHAVAQFWSTSDPTYAAWFLKRFRVEFVWREERDASDGTLVSIFGNEDVEILKVDEGAVERALSRAIATPETIPLGGRGRAYFGPGWTEGNAHRTLPPGRAKLYLPIDREILLEIEIESPADFGGLRIEGASALLSEEGLARFAISPRGGRGLHAIDVDWSGSSPLVVTGVRTTVVRQAREDAVR